MPADIAKKLDSINVSINRLMAQKASLQYKAKTYENKQREKRTRTLIQLGGLVDLTPLLSICGIELGDDLQMEHPDKAATLLGILITAANQLDTDNKDLQHFTQIGRSLLKQSNKNI